jgi:hypothetical protein
MSQGKDAAVQGVEPTVLGPAGDGRRPEAKRFELLPRDHSALPSGALGEVPERVRSYFCSHGIHKYERTLFSPP